MSDKNHNSNPLFYSVPVVLNTVRTTQKKKKKIIVSVN